MLLKECLKFAIVYFPWGDTIVIVEQGFGFIAYPYNEQTCRPIP